MGALRILLLKLTSVYSAVLDISLKPESHFARLCNEQKYCSLYRFNGVTSCQGLRVLNSSLLFTTGHAKRLPPMPQRSSPTFPAPHPHENRNTVFPPTGSMTSSSCPPLLVFLVEPPPSSSSSASGTPCACPSRPSSAPSSRPWSRPSDAPRRD